MSVTNSHNVSCVPTSGSGLWKTGIQVGVSAIINIGRPKMTRSKIVLKLVVFLNLDGNSCFSMLLIAVCPLQSRVFRLTSRHSAFGK
ncbi:MAG: hypothetical protein MUO99_04210, partial [Dehalococcoidales bacterium]|nr:hypothetical protein [Dehalococcoidales bacterium]